MEPHRAPTTPDLAGRLSAVYREGRSSGTYAFGDPLCSPATNTGKDQISNGTSTACFPERSLMKSKIERPCIG